MILFDLDGTLTDSGEGIMNCAAHALNHFGIEIPPREELRRFVGPPLLESFAKFGVPEDKLTEAIDVYRQRYLPIGKFENYPYPGIPELLQRLQAEGHKLYVATSKPEGTSVEICDHFDLSKYFVRICGASSDHDTSRNTKDAVIAYLLEECGRDEKIIMVGDTAYDVLGAKVHNIPAIAVTWGYGNVEDMKAAGAIGFAGTTDELYGLLTEY